MTGDDAPAKVLAKADEGLPKMWTIHKALQLRRERPASFGAEADYVPLMVDGAKHDHVIAYLRGEDIVTVVPRLILKLGGAWKDTSVTLPEGRWRNRMTGAKIDGGEVGVKELLENFPVALLAREDVGEKADA